MNSGVLKAHSPINPVQLAVRGTDCPHRQSVPEVRNYMVVCSVPSARWCSLGCLHLTLHCVCARLMEFRASGTNGLAIKEGVFFFLQSQRK